MATNATVSQADPKKWLDLVNQIDEVGFHLKGISRIMRVVFEDKNGADLGLWHLAESVVKAAETLDEITDAITAANRPAEGK